MFSLQNLACKGLRILSANTVQYHYNAVNFPNNPHNMHPIAFPWGQDMDVFCEYKFWFMFCLSHFSAVYNIVLHRTTL